ncbi:MAG: hypothetical protein E7166_00620 [Firmicutes bacterium]|nr:hypothetical protein [Bacillota bacterium]
MDELVVEVGMKLTQDLIYYHDLLENHGLKLVFSCITQDLYYTKDNLEGMTENQIKNHCIRLRICNALNKENNNTDKIYEKEKELITDGYKKVFDTKKIDFQYCNDTMKSRVQLQIIKDIGLLVYYDNPDYYNYPLEEQRNLLLEELNTYGFNFKNTDLGLDKLRTLYYKKEMYSYNQNG